MDFQILGPLHVIDADRIVDLGSPKQRGVLASLLLRANQVVSLDRLIDEVWGELPPLDPMAAIHVYVSRLRRALEPDRLAGSKKSMLVRAPPGYRLDIAIDAVDSRRFEQLAHEGSRALEHGDSERAAGLLERALSLWRGEALADLRWLGVAQAEAIRLDQIRLRAVEELFEAQLALGRHESVVVEAGSVLAGEPYRERLRGLLMLALYRCHRQVDALRVYSEGRAVLADELGLEPSPAIQQLEDDILLQKAHLDWRPAAERSGVGAGAGRSDHTAASVRSGVPFVGRDPELAALVAHWDRAVDGERQMVIVSGEPGIGKTRLAAELAVIVRRDGGTVLRGAAHPHTVVPYQVFAEALASLATEASLTELRGDVTDSGAAIARLAPDLAGRVIDLAEPDRADPATNRFRLFESVANLIHRVAERAPLLVALDDLQWADQGSWLLLSHLSRSPIGGRILVVAIVRDTQPLAATPDAILAGLRRDGAQQLKLRALDEQAVRELVVARLGATPRDVPGAIASRTSGNPFYVEQILESIADRAPDVGTVRSLVSADVAGMAVPESVIELVSQRVRALSPAAARALTIASVQGTVFDLDVVGEVSEVGAEELLDALDEAVMARLVVEEPGSVGRYRFTHALTVDALYGGVTATRRAALHHRVGLALESLPRVRDEQPAVLAHHLLSGGRDVVQGAAYAAAAGTRALAQLSHEDAATLFERGLQALAGRDDGDAVRTDLLLGLAEAQGRAGDVAAARNALAGAAAQARQIGDADRLARAATTATRGYLTVLPEPDDIPVSLLEEALAHLGDEDSARRVRVMSRLAVGLYFSEDQDRAGPISCAAVEMARRLGSDEVLGHALLSQHLALQDPAHLEDRRRVTAELMNIAECAGDLELELCSQYLPVADLLELGDLDAADTAMSRCERMIAQTQQPLLRVLPAQHRAMRAILTGRLDEGERLANVALQLARDGGYHYAQTFGSLLFELRWLQGRLAEVEDRLSRYAERQPGFAGWRAAVAMVCSEGGRLDEARGHFDVLAAHEFSDGRFDHTWTTVMVTNAEVCAALGDAPRAALLYERLMPFHDRLVVLGSGAVCIGAIDRTLGQLATVAGRFDDAEEHFRRADELNRRALAAPFVAWTQVDHAVMLHARRRRGDIARADALLGAARATAEDLGLEGLQSRIRRFAG
jgi:DNA-binding SARP family transcriptional activator/tetratricopeptide (TPR) repeat protein